MSLLKNGDDDSINFQKASCTLDGCVKIWTSRVDSVATETGKLLSGLAEDGRKHCQVQNGGFHIIDSGNGYQAPVVFRKTSKMKTTTTMMMRRVKRRPRRK